METCTKEYDTVLLSMRGVSYMDISGAIAFMHVLSDLQAEGKRILLCGVPTSTMAMLKRSDIYDMIGEERIFTGAWKKRFYMSKTEALPPGVQCLSLFHITFTFRFPSASAR